MTGLTSELAERSFGLSFDQLPDDVIAMARLCVLDWLGVTVVGSRNRLRRHCCGRWRQTPSPTAPA
jgi:2-methylcitrate dehydratase PrpD